MAGQVLAAREGERLARISSLFERNVARLIKRASA
jgi:hypothetical protein